MNGKRKHFNIKLRIQVTEFEFPIWGPIWGIGSSLSPNFKDGECRWKEGLFYLNVFHPHRDREASLWGCSKSSLNLGSKSIATKREAFFMLVLLYSTSWDSTNVFEPKNIG